MNEWGHDAIHNPVSFAFAKDNYYLLPELLKSSRSVSMLKKHQSIARLIAVPSGFTGGANRDRTGDLLLAKQALSQLSYGPVAKE
jgi:hypothetical protein